MKIKGWKKNKFYLDDMPVIEVVISKAGKTYNIKFKQILGSNKILFSFKEPTKSGRDYMVRKGKRKISLHYRRMLK